MSEAEDVIARCRDLLKFAGGRETAKDWPLPIPRADLAALLTMIDRRRAPQKYPDATRDSWLITNVTST